MKNYNVGRKSIVFAIVFLLGASVIPSLADTIYNSQDEEYTIELNFNDFELTFGYENINGYEFATINLLNEGYTTTIGYAKLPMYRTMVEIPYGSEPTIIIDSESWETTTLDNLNLPNQILPVQQSIQKDQGTQKSAELILDTEFYQKDTFFPNEIVNIVETGEIRGRRYALVEISPIQYKPSNGEIRIINNLKSHITIEDCDIERTYQNIEKYYSPSFETSFEKSFLNYGEFKDDTTFFGKQTEGFLFIVHDSLYSDIQPFVTLKEDKGYDVTVTQTSDIPGGATVDNIETYIQDAYNNWPTPPSYILLVGDTNLVPTKTSGLEWGVSCSDLYYVTVAGSDFIPDIRIGRFPADDATDLVNIVDKTVFYEEGDFPTEEWIKKAAFIASSDMSQFAEQTHNYVIDTYMIPNGYICDKIYEASGGSTADITNALNEGRSLCVYSGHGSPSGWACVPFYQSNIQSLTNYQMYPFVCSHACSTAPFDDDECFGETWLLTADKGGIGHWGASCSTYWDEDDILEKGMFKSWWADGQTTIGGMTDGGLIYLYDYYGGGGNTQYYFEGYNVLGDPSLVLVGSNSSGSNTPPNKPETPDGPEEGETGLECIFSTSTTDNENDDVYYMWNWGNEVSDWLGPYESGITIQFPHTWDNSGEYYVKVKAKDTEGFESSWSNSVLINIIGIPHLEIGEITGGFGLTAEIKNTGGVEAVNVDWNIKLDGFVLIGKEKSGNFTKIMPGFSPIATTGFVFGIGPVDITVTADDAEKNVQALLIGPFVLNVG